MTQIKGRLIRASGKYLNNFFISPELWEWIYAEFPKFVGKEVVISIREAEQRPKKGDEKGG